MKFTDLDLDSQKVKRGKRYNSNFRFNKYLNAQNDTLSLELF